MISAINEVETAVQAMKHGAYHYITKNFDYDELRSLVRNACERQDLNRQVMTLQRAGRGTERTRVPHRSEPADPRHRRSGAEGGEAVGDRADPGRERHRQGTARAAAAPGIGHAARRRSSRSISSAIPHELVESTLFGHERGAFTGAHKQQLGKFELATGGTLFLDEIGDLRLDLQAKLLRAIQEGEIERVGGSKPIKTNFRLVVATNVDLEKAVKDGRFREDLYYRINVIPIRMPPLRDRIEDLPELARLFLRSLQAKFRKPVRGISGSALKILASYWWPGNIRELENLIERLVAVSDKEWITDEDLPLEYHFAKLDSGPTTGDALFQEACETFERNFILRALEKSDWNVTATARYLGIPLSTLKHKMSRLDLREIARKLRGA